MWYLINCFLSLNIWPLFLRQISAKCFSRCIEVRTREDVAYMAVLCCVYLQAFGCYWSKINVMSNLCTVEFFCICQDRLCIFFNYFEDPLAIFISWVDSPKWVDKRNKSNPLPHGLWIGYSVWHPSLILHLPLAKAWEKGLTRMPKDTAIPLNNHIHTAVLLWPRNGDSLFVIERWA